jgi:hypothetical protein
MRAKLLVVLVVTGVSALGPSRLQAAPAARIDVTICGEFETSFDDWRVGDFWNKDPADATACPDGKCTYWARGVEYSVSDDYGTQSGFLDDETGCVGLRLLFSGASRQFDVTFKPNARVNGVDLRSFVENPVDPTLAGALQFLDHQVDQATQGATYRLGIGALSGSALGRQWQNLAVGTWMFHRADFHIHEGVSRNCCTYYDAPRPEGAPAYGNKSGSCNPPWGSDYHHLGPPVIYISPVDQDTHPTSRYPLDTVGGPNAPAIVSNSRRKVVVAHETGHVIVALRMGDSAPKSGAAPLDGCMADWKGTLTADGLTLTAGTRERLDCDDDDPDPTCPDSSDTSHEDYSDMRRGDFTKEYNSMASNEGWANFVAMWAWNDNTEDNCTFDAPHVTDFDLNTVFSVPDIDNGNAQPEPPPLYSDMNGWVDCDGSPWWWTPPAPFESTFMTSRNWLASLEDANDQAGCTVAAAHEDNRGTVNDWSKFFWDMNQRAPYGEDVSVGQLADLYVDMCPLAWAMTDKSWTFPTQDAHPDEFPLQRLKTSADHHSLAPALAGAISNIERH